MKKLFSKIGTYFSGVKKEIGRISLLSPEEELKLSIQIANGDEDKVWDSIPKANVPKAVKVIQYRTNPDWTQEYKLPWRTFRSAQEAESYVKELEKQWKTFTKFFI